MKPDDIRRMYRQETEATDEEAAATRAEIRTDPEQARRFLQVVYALSTEERDTALLLKLFLEGILMLLIEERAARDDAFALHCAGLLLDLQDKLKPPPRGKPKNARSA